MNPDLSVSVAFMVGYGRSGSTILGSALGGHSEIAHTDELMWLPFRVDDPERFYSCGARLGECAFWHVVIERLTASEGSDALVRLAATARLRPGRREGVRRSAGGAPARRGWASGRLPPAQRCSVPRHHRGEWQACDCRRVDMAGPRAAARRGGRNLYPHPSSDPLPSFGQRVAPPTDEEGPAKGILRDIEGRPAPLTTLSWIQGNLQCEAVTRALPPERRLRLRHENFTAAPAAGLARLGAFLGVDPAGFPQAVDVAAQHVFAGNRVRMERALIVELRPSDGAELPLFERVTPDFLAFGPFRFYGWGPL